MFCVRKLLIALVIVGTFGLGSNATARADTISFPGSNQHSNQVNVIASLEGLVNNVKVFVPDHSSTNLVLSSFQGSGIATILLTTLSGRTVNFEYSLGVGNNFVTVSNTDGAYSAVNLNQPAGPTDLRQQKISLYQAVAALPDSTTMLLFGGGLAGIAAEFRRRRRI